MAAEQVHREQVQLEPVNTSDDLKAEAPPTFNALQTRALLRKIDYHLIPLLSLLYLLSFLEYVRLGVERDLLC